jgi:hypothetical protein
MPLSPLCARKFSVLSFQFALHVECVLRQRVNNRERAAARLLAIVAMANGGLEGISVGTVAHFAT